MDFDATSLTTLQNLAQYSHRISSSMAYCLGAKMFHLSKGLKASCMALQAIKSDSLAAGSLIVSSLVTTMCGPRHPTKTIK